MKCCLVLFKNCCDLTEENFSVDYVKLSRDMLEMGYSRSNDSVRHQVNMKQCNIYFILISGTQCKHISFTKIQVYRLHSNLLDIK